MVVWQEVESIKSGALDFLPYTEEHFSGGTKDCECSLIVDNISAFFTEGINAHEVVSEG